MIKANLFRGAGSPWVLPLLVTALLHLFAGVRYGLFRDELYYLACADRVEWAFVDHPSFSVLILRIATNLFGNADGVVRSLSGSIAVLSVAMMALLTRQMGGSPRAQNLAAWVVAGAPVFRVTGLFYSPNTLDLPLWIAVILAWRRCVEPDAPISTWAWLGLALGIAANNRLSAIWLVIALVMATIVMRPSIARWGPVLTGALAIAMMGPWIYWQVVNQWPTLEFVRNANFRKLVPVSPWQFVATQVVVMGILSLPVWLGGTIVGFRRADWRPYAAAFVTVAVVLIANGRSRENYLSPAYAFVVPLGAMWLDERLRASFSVLASGIAVTGVGFAFICMPILDPPVLAAILAKLPTPPSTEKGPKSVLQGLSDTLGWRHQVSVVSKTWNSIPEAERKGAVIITWNYGEAAAIMRNWREFPLPEPMSGHNNYWIWGRGKKRWSGERALLVGAWPASERARFKKVREVGRNDDRWSTPEEGQAPIYWATGGHVIWKQLRRYE